MSKQLYSKENLGEPDISFSGFQLWLHSRNSDGWFNATAHQGALGAEVWVSGSILRLVELEGWLKRLKKMSTSLSGEANLWTAEPYIDISFKTIDQSGHIKSIISITPDHIFQVHKFEEVIDQSYLPNLINQLNNVIKTFSY